MDGNRRKYFKKPGNNLFKRKGVSSSRKGKWSDSHGGEEFSGDGDTVYRILCPSRKIGGVIGKGGNIVKALREETQSKITVADSVQGSDERVIIIYSSSDKPPRKMDGDEGLATGNGQQEAFEPHCAAQDALLKVHDRIVEEDLFGGMASDDDNDNNVVTARLLVPNNMVGCVLGKRGDVIQRLRSETGANIRVLPADHLPSCAMDTDELVQHGGMQVLLVRWVFFNCLLASHEQLTYAITMNCPQRCDNDFSNTDQLICLTECSLYWKEGYSFKFEFQRYILK